MGAGAEKERFCAQWASDVINQLKDDHNNSVFECMKDQ